MFRLTFMSRRARQKAQVDMKLSEFKDEKAIAVIADLLGPIGNIARVKANADARNKTPLEFAASILKNNPKDCMTMLAILDDKDPASYHCNAATVLADMVNMLSDDELMALFGLRSKTPASSGSASGNIEAH